MSIGGDDQHVMIIHNRTRMKIIRGLDWFFLDRDVRNGLGWGKMFSLLSKKYHSSQMFLDIPNVSVDPKSFGGPN
jgi:hypothetical protein